MLTDSQVRRLFVDMSKEITLRVGAARNGMDEKSARKYLKLHKLPSELHHEHTWLTREDSFMDDWHEIEGLLENNNELEAKTIFEYLQRKAPGKYQDGQLRTLQRRIKVWRALSGPPREVYFPRVHKPGELCESDFTDMTKLGITLSGSVFVHLLYHFVLTYSNWESASICFSESFESLSDGLQQGLWRLGGVPEYHRTDQLTTAVQQVSGDKPKFNKRYQALLNHLRLKGQKTQPSRPNENGDIEQRHHRLFRALDQALMLRGSRDFTDRSAYEDFLQALIKQLNAGRQTRLSEEQQRLKPLPSSRLEGCKRLKVRVGPSSTIRIAHNVYSVHSRLIREEVEARLYSCHIEIWYGQRCLEKLHRLPGTKQHSINYRHIIDWLVRKPGAFANYRYRQDLFPSSIFRIAYDALCEAHSQKIAEREYLQILYFAARESESEVSKSLDMLLGSSQPFAAAKVKELLSGKRLTSVKGTVKPVNLQCYDHLLSRKEVG